MLYCPNCGYEIASNISTCPTCDAVFGPGSAWHPLAEPPAPPVGRRPISGVIAVVCLLSGVFGAFYSLKMYFHGPGAFGALIPALFLIGAGCGLAIIAGVVAIVRKERWMGMHVIVLLVS